MKNDPNTNSQINLYKEKTTMTTNTTNTVTTNTVTTNTVITNNTTDNKETFMNQNIIPKTSDLTQLNYQDMPEIAQWNSVFPFCKSAKVGNLFYPVITSDRLMDFIALDANFVEAARKVKLNAFNPSGSEHGIVKKVCDMILDYPRLRQMISQDLLQGDYCPERIASDDVFATNHMTLPRGFKYTMNQIVQTMIMQIVRISLAGDYTLSLAWGKATNSRVSTMLNCVDVIRERGFQNWIPLKLKNVLDNIPHDRLMQKIRIVFQDKRVADLICTLLGLNASTSNGPRSQHVGIPKDSPLAALLGYELYLSELDQEIMRLGLTHVRYDDEIVVFCDNYAAAEQIRGTLVAFVKNVLECPVDHNRTRIKDIAHLAFLGVRLQGGQWHLQYSVKKAAASKFIILLMAYGRFQEEHYLWSAYRKLTKFISRYEDVYDLRNEIKRLKKWRDGHITHMVAFVEKVKLGLEKLPE